MAKKRTKAATLADTETYVVGPGRPPLHTRYPKGVSGNPKGRPKGSLNIKTLIDRNLGKPVNMRENGEEVEVTAADAAVMKLFQLCVGDDRKACMFIIETISKHSTDESHRGEDIVDEDRKILERALGAQNPCAAHRTRRAKPAKRCHTKAPMRDLDDEP